MLGSCCEEQEAKEAEARARITAATRFNEERMLAGHRLREDLFKKLRCPEGCSCNDGGECGECEEEEEEQSQASGQKDGATAGSTPDADEDDDSLDEDAEEEAFMNRMRATRLQQMRADALAATKRLAARGAHARLREEQSVSTLLSDPTDGSPIILHLANGEDETDHCIWVEDALRRAARELPFARLVTEICQGNGVPECLSFISQTPTLLVVERGLVSAVCDQLVAVREPEAVRALVNGWLEGERTRLAKKYSGSGGESDEDEDDEEGGSYCGIPGCKPYFHQHVGSRKRAE